MGTQWVLEPFSLLSVAMEMSAPSPRLPTPVPVLRDGISCSSLTDLPPHTLNGSELVEIQPNWELGQISLISILRVCKQGLLMYTLDIPRWTCFFMVMLMGLRSLRD
jgi:hypothetical protein